MTNEANIFYICIIVAFTIESRQLMYQRCRLFMDTSRPNEITDMIQIQCFQTSTYNITWSTNGERA